MAIFVIQNPEQYPDAGIVFHAIEQANRSKLQENEAVITPIQELRHIEGQDDIVPVGTPEYIEKVLALTLGLPTGKYRIKPLNIPKQLDTQDFVLGYIASDVPARDIPQHLDLVEQLGYGKEILVSSASHISDNSPIRISKAILEKKPNLFPDKELYFLQSPVKYTAKWRCFVCLGELLAVRQISGPPFEAPPKRYIKHIIDSYSLTDYHSDPFGYAFDVGVSETGLPGLDKVHYLNTCSLCGYDDEQLPRAIKLGYYCIKIAVSELAERQEKEG